MERTGQDHDDITGLDIAPRPYGLHPVADRLVGGLGLGAAGRKRAMARAVAPLLVQATMTAALSSTAARQAAAPMAAVMRDPMAPSAPKF